MAVQAAFNPVETLLSVPSGRSALPPSCNSKSRTEGRACKESLRSTRTR